MGVSRVFSLARVIPLRNCHSYSCSLVTSRSSRPYLINRWRSLGGRCTEPSHRPTASAATSARGEFSLSILFSHRSSACRRPDARRQRRTSRRISIARLHYSMGDIIRMQADDDAANGYQSRSATASAFDTNASSSGLFTPSPLINCTIRCVQRATSAQNTEDARIDHRHAPQSVPSKMTSSDDHQSIRDEGIQFMVCSLFTVYRSNQMSSRPIELLSNQPTSIRHRHDQRRPRRWMLTSPALFVLCYLYSLTNQAICTPCMRHHAGVHEDAAHSSRRDVINGKDDDRLGPRCCRVHW